MQVYLMNYTEGENALCTWCTPQVREELCPYPVTAARFLHRLKLPYCHVTTIYQIGGPGLHKSVMCQSSQILEPFRVP